MKLYPHLRVEKDPIYIDDGNVYTTAGVEAACGHLEMQTLPVKTIARLTGFRDEQSLRRAFVQQLSMTPREYRDQFAAFMASDLRSDLPSEPAAT